ncbi:unnamed protein product, partial [Adineta steineri]
MHPLQITLAYLLIYKFDSKPQLNSSINRIDGWSLFCPSNLTSDDHYNYFIDNQRTVGHQSVIFGLRELNSTEKKKFCSNLTINTPPILDQSFNFTKNYELRTYTSGCYYLDKNNNWQSDGLLVGPLTNHYKTQCFSTHLTTFAGGFLVLPEPINWNYVFANAGFNRNKTIYLTVICLSIIYFLLIIYARYKDKKDIEKLGVTILPDNLKQDQYFYQIIVFTGHRKRSGTKSKVHFILAGDQDETQVRIFADPNRKIFQRGGVDSFVMSVEKSLGPLNYIRLWHDNTGPGSSASWFLKYIIVRDLQTMEKSYFICQKWLAVEKDDGLIERLLPIAGELQKQEFSYLLAKKAYYSVSEGHLWFSIFSRPPSDKFTRVQRCTCCFVFLFQSMFLNILYYNQISEAKAANNTTSLSFGPLYITPQQIGIGVIVEILVFVPSLLLIQFFRRIRSRHNQKQVSALHQAIFKLKQLPITKTSIEYDKKKKGQIKFPWWCIFFAYGFSLLLTVISIFFIIVKGIEFGDLKTQKWLTSLVSGFFSSIFLVQPIKIISVAVIFAYIIRKPDNDKEAAEYMNDDVDLAHDEEYFPAIEDISPFNHRSGNNTNRLEEGEVAFAREQRLKHVQMWAIIREILNYVGYLCLLYVIIYSNKNQNAFLQVQHLRNFFLNTRSTNDDYTKISTMGQYWNWLENNFVKNIRAQQWYNGDPPRNLSGYLNDKTNRFIGWATMRQLRIKSQSCHIQHMSIQSECQYDYSLLSNEKDSFQPGWNLTNQTNQIYSSSIQQAFIYQTGGNLKTYISIGKFGTYGSGGYVYEFRGRLVDLQTNLSQLYQLSWIDSQTRAIFLQFTLYNPNIQLFTSATFLTEFSSTGGVYTQSSFQPFSLQLFTSLGQIICAIFYILFIIYMMCIQIQNIVREKQNYFRHIWSFIDIGIIICSWTCVGIYIVRFQESNHIGELFQETKGFSYINLQSAVYINDILTLLLSFCCFFGTIKLIRLARFHPRLLLFTETLKYAWKEIISFLFMFMIIFLAYIILFYLILNSKLYTCSNLLHTTQMLFEMTLMKFDVYQLLDADPILGPICFSLFIFTIVFVCMTMFITIISDNFRVVRNNLKFNHNH